MLALLREPRLEERERTSALHVRLLANLELDPHNWKEMQSNLEFGGSGRGAKAVTDAIRSEVCLRGGAKFYGVPLGCEAGTKRRQGSPQGAAGSTETITLGRHNERGEEHLARARDLARRGKYAQAKAALKMAQDLGWNDLGLVDLLERVDASSSRKGPRTSHR